MRCVSASMSVVLVLGIGAGVWAQSGAVPGAAPVRESSDPAPRSAAPASAPSPPPPLSGPRVGDPRAGADAAAPPTLVRRDFSGKVERLEIPPAEAALALLELDERTRGAVERVLLERSMALDRIVAENLGLLVSLSNAAQAGEKDEAARLVRELYQKAEPLRERGALQDELADVLPAEQAARLKGLVREYWTAVVQERRGEVKNEERMGGAPGREGKRRGGTAGALMREEVVKAVGAELKRAYERVVTQRTEDFDALIKELGLSPETEGEVRRIVTDSFQKTLGKPDRGEKARVFWEVYRRLDAEGKKRLMERVIGEQGTGG